MNIEFAAQWLVFRRRQRFTPHFALCNAFVRLGDLGAGLFTGMKGLFLAST